MLRHYLIKILITALVLILPAGGSAIAQTDTDASAGGTSGGDSSSDSAEMVTFDEPADLSLFVGHYRLNPGDSIYVEIITDTTRAFYPMIDEEGFITIPVIGRVHVGELTSTEAREKIQELADEYYRNAWVTVRISQIAKVKFYVYGDIRAPGFYTAPGSTTFFDFLQKFNLARSAQHRRIVHVKGDINAALPEPVDLIGGERETSADLINRSLDLYAGEKFEEIDPRVTILDPLDFTIEGEIELKNFYLEYGDVIYIPDPRVLVNVDGFRRSGFYEVLPNETWTDILNLAGEPSHVRDIANIILERRDVDGDLSQLYYNLNMLSDEELSVIPLEHRDQIKAVYYDTSVYVMGEVALAGAYPYSPLSNPLDYIALAGGSSTDAHLKFVRIVRPPRNPLALMDESEIFEINVIDSINDGAPLGIIEMQPGDIIFVPGKGDEIGISAMLTGLSIMVNAIRLFE